MFFTVGKCVLCHVARLYVTLPSCRAALQVQRPQQGPPEQRVPQPGVRGEPVHIAGRLLQLRLHSSHPICPEGHASRWLLITPAPPNRDESQFVCFLFCGKTSPPTCQSVAPVIVWLSGHGCVVLTSLPRPSSRSAFDLTDSLCAALLPLFQMCVIRKDMKSAQDRLLAQMVSRVDTFGSSALIRPQPWSFSLSLSAALCFHEFVSTSVFSASFFQMLFLHLLQQEEEIQSVKRGLHALFFAWWSFQLHSKAPQLKNGLAFEIGAASFRFVQVLPNVPCYCWFNWECYLISIYL